MTTRPIVSCLVVFVAIACATVARGQDKPDVETTKDAPATEPEKEKAAAKPKIEVATLGGGCFWCTEAVFERLKGVKQVVSGYSGGHVPNPTYEMVCSGLTGHAEVVQVQFDPSEASYEKILRLFFASHDPTTLNSQGPDFGTQYRSIIFYHTEEQRQTALKVYKDLTARKAFRGPIVTQLEPFQSFFAAEPYHQNYYRNHPNVPYSQTYITPKLRKLKGK
ncbi:MAG: peptide-methionine (S)-S-oxide reductase MsrA [Isosphaeraceae bacterium]